MAQTGYTPILIYSSSTAAAAPIAGNLTNSTLGSELAINITDGKLFYKDNANAIQVIGWKTTPTTAGGTGLTSYTAGDLLYYASGTALSKLGIGAANTVLTSSGSAPQWSTNLNIGSLTATSISNSGNLTFTGTGNRIIGDFSNATVASRVMFQTSTVNSATSIYAIPNGTSTTSQFVAVSNSDPTNASVLQLLSLSTDAQIRAGVTGTGTLVPLTLYAGGAERLRLFTSGGVSIGNTTDPGASNLSLSGDLQLFTAGKKLLNSNGRAMLNQTGGILQVVQNTNTGSSATTSTTFVDVTNFTVSITPSSTSSKILIIASSRLINTLVAATNVQYYQALLRGATSLMERYMGAESAGGGLQALDSMSVCYLDSPATTSSTTYKIQHRVSIGTSTGTCSEGYIIALEIAG